MSRLLAVLFVLICMKEGASNDVTTMYKFHRFESDSNDEQYFDTCSVSVHVDDSKIQLPLININGDNLLPETTIPPLYSDQGDSTWFQMRQNNTTLPLPKIKSAERHFSNIHLIDSSIIDEIRNSYEMDTIEEITPAPDQYSRVTVFENKEFLKKIKNTRTVLEVTFPGPSNLDLYLYRNDLEYINIELYHTQMRVCLYLSYLYCLEALPKYSMDENSLAHIAIDITDDITIFDQVASVSYRTSYHVLGKNNGYTKLEHSFDSQSPTVYKVKQQTAVTVVSSWIDNFYNQSLFILFSGHDSSNLSVYSEDLGTSQQIEFDCEEINHVKNTDGLDIVLTKAYLTYAHNWTGQHRIKIVASGDVAILNVWEGRSLDLYKIQGAQPCVKSNITDIYNTLLDIHTKAQIDNISHCFNGGRLENNSFCICPPGFTSHACETPCGSNQFGSKCSRQCSRSGNECQGVVLCTPEHGCSCAPGYQGDHCSEECQPGFYGADCTQECGHCKGECDIYTGDCLEGCNTPYLLLPQCKQSRSYLKSSGKVLSLNFNEIHYEIDFSANNLVKFNDNTLYYMIQFRKNTSSSWDNMTSNGGIDDFYDVFEEGISLKGTFINLEAGHIYQFRTILLDGAFETHDPSLTEPFEIELCEGETLKVKNKTSTSIGLSWTPETEEESTVCHSKGYILEITQTENDHLEKERVIETVKNLYEVKYLNPGQTYHMQLKKLNSHNESLPISSINVTTVDDEIALIDDANMLKGVTIFRKGSEVHIEWFENPAYTTYYVKYKLRRHFPCRKQETTSTLHVAATSDTFYNLELKDLESNALYELFVTGDINENINPQNKSFTSLANKKTWKCIHSL